MSPSLQDLFQRYDISHYGFLPNEEPLTRLPHSYYEPWERIITRLHDLITDGNFYLEIQALPVLDTSLLLTVQEWRRAYVILSFFTHAHIWSGPIPHEVLPPCISRPLIEVSNFLGLPPTATYPALNLWNCALRQPHHKHDITNPDHVLIQHTFTGTSDEIWFYAVSVSVEAKGREAIELMLQAVDAAAQQDDIQVLSHLTAFGDVIQQLGKILQRMHEHCDPYIFYHRIRPFLAGSRGMEHAGLPRGILYDEGNGTASWKQYSGGSNAQSALIQFLDIALGVRHGANAGAESGNTRASSGSANSVQHSHSGSHTSTVTDVTISKQTYLEEMRNYMPRSHRQFLTHFATIASMRTYAATKPPQSAIAQAFDRAVDALTAFRNVHINIVARYIVAQSKSKSQPTRTRDQSKSQPERTGDDESEATKVQKRARDENEVAKVNTNKLDIASASSDSSRATTALKGTGGTDLIAFLKQTRDETRAAGVGIKAEEMVVTG